MKKTLLLVFIHGFKGSDHTFHSFPVDLRALLSFALPKIDIVSVQYPKFETRGDLHKCVADFKEWLQNKVIDIEVSHQTPSPTVDPSVHVILCGHSMGGIVAAETLLSIAKDEPLPIPRSFDTADSTNSTTTDDTNGKRATNLPVDEPDQKPSSGPPPEQTKLFFPYVKAVLAFDTPYLGISPGVLAHGAEEQINHASTAYKAFDAATQLFGWGSPRSASPQPIANASSRGLPAPEDASGSGRNWGKYAMYGGAAAAVAGAAGAAYLSWNQINQGLAWASSHLEFVGCLGRGAELQKRVEDVVELTKTHNIGFADFYTALSEEVSRKTANAGAIVGQERTFCVVPNDARRNESPTGTKRNAPSAETPQPKRRRTKSEQDMEREMEEGEKVKEYAEDMSKNKGTWVKCVNPFVGDELRAHTSMFEAKRNPDYHRMLPRARDYIVDWVDQSWYEGSDGPIAPEPSLEKNNTDGGAEAEA